MAKYENIRALAKKQLQAVTESSDRWKAFLRTAAIAYNYSFPNQLLIHEQSPTATAVADIAYWNNNAGRWVKRGAHGIAVFDTRANSSRLRYLFDISDTIPRAEVPDALPWVITDQNWRPVWDKIVADNHADSIQSALLMLSTSCVAQRSAMFTTALGKAIDGSSLQWAKPDEQRQLFIQLITQSCLYMAALRCGVDTARLDLSALESVNQFDTNRITLCLGSACQQAARPLMQQIGSITREIDSVARAEKVRYYGDKQEETNNTKEVNNGVHDGERLPYAECRENQGISHRTQLPHPQGKRNSLFAERNTRRLQHCQCDNRQRGVKSAYPLSYRCHHYRQIVGKEQSNENESYRLSYAKTRILLCRSESAHR